jgi:hypothetical protein
MDQNSGEQNNQSQEKQSEGRISQGINAVNNLVGGGIKNPFGKIGSRVAVQAATKATFLATNP